MTKITSHATAIDCTFILCQIAHSQEKGGLGGSQFAACAPVQSPRLSAADAAINDQFGYSVAASGDTVIIGAWLDDHAVGTDAGSAYVFVRDGAGVWTQQAKLTALEPPGNDNNVFGFSVAISGDTAVIGAHGNSNVVGFGAGAAYVFVRSGTVWAQQAKLLASDIEPGANFGVSVSLSADTAVIGAYNDNGPAGTDAGAAYVFVRSGGAWNEQAKLVAPDAATSDFFGNSVAVAGDTAVVGAYRANAVGSDSGAAYVFFRSGTSWTMQQKVVATDASFNDQFGISVAVSGNTVLVGSWLDTFGNSFNAGSAYAFVRNGSVWTQQQKLTASDARDSNLFGVSVAIVDGVAVIGSHLSNPTEDGNSGSAYIFRRAGSTWTQQSKLIASDAAGNDQFGFDVALSNNRAFIGSPKDNHAGGIDAGSLYVFDLVGCQPCVADITGDGTVNVSDLLAVINAWGPCGGCAADITGDGVVGVNDLLAVINAWGPCQ